MRWKPWMFFGVEISNRGGGCTGEENPPQLIWSLFAGFCQRAPVFYWSCCGGVVSTGLSENLRGSVKITRNLDVEG